MQHVKNHCSFARESIDDLRKRETIGKVWCVNYEDKLALLADEELMDDEELVDKGVEVFMDPIVTDVKPLVEENLFELSLANIVENYALYLNSRRSGKKLKDVTKTQRIRRLRRIVNLCELKKLKQLLDDEYQRKIIEKLEQLNVQGQTLWYYVADICFLLSYIEIDIATNISTETFLRKAHLKWTNVKQSFTSDLIEDRAAKQKADVDDIEDGNFVTLANCHKSLVLLKPFVSAIKFDESPTKHLLNIFFTAVALNYALKSIIRPSIFCNMSRSSKMQS